jgi:hypothetical protein
MDIVQGFLAIVILAELDDCLFMTVEKEPLSLLIKEGEFNLARNGVENIRTLDEITKIEITCSATARFKLSGNKRIPPKGTDLREVVNDETAKEPNNLA